MPEPTTPDQESTEAEKVIDEATTDVNDPGGAHNKGYSATPSKEPQPGKEPTSPAVVAPRQPGQLGSAG